MFQLFADEVAGFLDHSLHLSPCLDFTKIFYMRSINLCILPVSFPLWNSQNLNCSPYKEERAGCIVIVTQHLIDSIGAGIDSLPRNTFLKLLV